MGEGTIEPEDLASLCEVVSNGGIFEYAFFWRETEAPLGALSQWARADFEVDGRRYSSAEQYMMAEKAARMGDLESWRRIVDCDDPGEIKRLGRAVRPYDEARWAAVREHVVVRGNLARFGQDAAARAVLLGTGDAILVEASPYDQLWGIGLEAAHPDARDPARWRGPNLLGFSLMRVRASLREGAP